MSADSPVRVHVDPELPPLPAAPGVVAADPFGADVWVRRAPLGAWPHRVAAVGVAEDPARCVADLGITPEQYAADGVGAVRRAHVRRLASRPRIEDGIEAWLDAIRVLTGADAVEFRGAGAVGSVGSLPPGLPALDRPGPAPQIVTEGGVAAVVAPTQRPEGAGVLIAAVRAGGGAWAAAVSPELVAFAAAMGAVTHAERAAALASRLDLVRAMLGVTVHDVRGALFGLELGTRLLARIPEAEAIRTNLQGSVGTPMHQVRQTLSSVRAVLEPAPDARPDAAAPWPLAEVWAAVVAEHTKQHPAATLSVERPIGDARVAVAREVVQCVLGALVDNALAHGPAGEPVRVGWSATPSGHRVEIRNRGRLPFADLAAIEPFAHRAPRRVGLGLWLARSEAARSGVSLAVVQEGDEVVAAAEFPSAG